VRLVVSTLLPWRSHTLIFRLSLCLADTSPIPPWFSACPMTCPPTIFLIFVPHHYNSEMVKPISNPFSLNCHPFGSCCVQHKAFHLLRSLPLPPGFCIRPLLPLPLLHQPLPTQLPSTLPRQPPLSHTHPIPPLVPLPT
jgi:hypothetical protein